MHTISLSSWSVRAEDSTERIQEGRADEGRELTGNDTEWDILQATMYIFNKFMALKVFVD
jgi:hypothetical protein